MTDVLINHPDVGSLWLTDCRIKGGYVIGFAWDFSDVGSAYLPDDYTGEPVKMGFKVKCIRKDPSGLLSGRLITRPGPEHPGRKEK